MAWGVSSSPGAGTVEIPGRDVFLRAEALTMHYGDGCLVELLDNPCPAHRMLGGLLSACWKVGGAANVEAYKGVPNV